MIFSKKKKTNEPTYKYNPDEERPIIRASICTGEQVAGFKNKHTGKFHEVMLIKDESDKLAFLESYGLEKADKEY